VLHLDQLPHRIPLRLGIKPFREAQDRTGDPLPSDDSPTGNKGMSTTICVELCL
jgi:hypothetical protein